jgi:membrane-associated protease RseP (regulator of RpoE activity)
LLVYTYLFGLGVDIVLRLDFSNVIVFFLQQLILINLAITIVNVLPLPSFD